MVGSPIDAPTARPAKSRSRRLECFSVKLADQVLFAFPGDVIDAIAEVEEKPVADELLAALVMCWCEKRTRPLSAICFGVSGPSSARCSRIQSSVRDIQSASNRMGNDVCDRIMSAAERQAGKP